MHNWAVIKNNDTRQDGKNGWILWTLYIYSLGWGQPARSKLVEPGSKQVNGQYRKTNEESQAEQRPPQATTADGQAQFLCRIKRGIIIPKSIHKKGKKMEAISRKFVSAGISEAVFIVPAVWWVSPEWT